MSENGNGKGREKGRQRDEKGQFVPGWTGGPGSGHTRQRQEISDLIASIKALSENDDLNLMDSEVLDLIGRLILSDVTSKDTKTRLDSIKQFLNLLGKRIEAAEREKQNSAISLKEISRIQELLELRQGMDVHGAEGVRENDQ